MVCVSSASSVCSESYNIDSRSDVVVIATAGFSPLLRFAMISLGVKHFEGGHLVNGLG